MNRQENMNNPNSCLNKADADEPLFILRAKDPIAPLVVRAWAMLSQQLRAHSGQKCYEAVIVAEDMEEWRTRMHGTPDIDWKS